MGAFEQRCDIGVFDGGDRAVRFQRETAALVDQVHQGDAVEHAGPQIGRIEKEVGRQAEVGRPHAEQQADMVAAGRLFRFDENAIERIER